MPRGEETVSAGELRPRSPSGSPEPFPLRRGGGRASAPGTREQGYCRGEGSGALQAPGRPAWPSSEGKRRRRDRGGAWPRRPPGAQPAKQRGRIPRTRSSPSRGSRVSSALLPPQTISGSALERRPETANRCSQTLLTANSCCDGWNRVGAKIRKGRESGAAGRRERSVPDAAGILREKHRRGSQGLEFPPTAQARRTAPTAPVQGRGMPSGVRGFPSR